MRILGWILVVWGWAGLGMNVGVLIGGYVAWQFLIVNTLFCILFIYLGKRILSRNRAIKTARQLQEEEEERPYW